MGTRLVLGIVAAAVVAGLVVAELATSGSGQAAKPAPPLPAQVLNGPKANLASLRGKPALVNFWASWCEPCRQEAPGLERLSKELRGRARLVGVDFNDDSTQNAEAFIRDHGLTYPIVRDGDGKVGERYGVSGLPTTFVLDADGQIVRTLRGPQSAAALREALSAAPPQSG
jgi:cytochrome c biogenesis protein CcmG, thiol:disulfide interchange protein DsbE